MAKAPAMNYKAGRRYLRHELATALALLAAPELLDDLDGPQQDLLLFLVASHHGKVRMVLRSLVDEERPRDALRLESADGQPGSPESARYSQMGRHNGADRLYALGILDGDKLPAANLGDNVQTEPITLSLDVMNLGEGPGGPSWTERARALRDADPIGPFRLAYYEALLRAADGRGSQLGTSRTEDNDD